MKGEIPPFLLTGQYRCEPGSTGAVSKTSFLAKGIDHLAGLIGTTYSQWETANLDGFLQGIDPRVKLLLGLFLIVVVSAKKSILPEVVMAGLVAVLVLVSRLRLWPFYRRVFFCTFFFGFLVALPSVLNIVVPGEVILPLLRLPEAHDFWIYHVPQTIGVTRQGVEGMVMLTLRVMNSLSLSLLVIDTTPFTEIVRALKSLRVPDSFLMIMILCYKYILLFARTLEEEHLAKKSKVVEVSAREGREWITGRIAFLFRKTRTRCVDIFDSMSAKGFSGEVVLCSGRELTARDIVAGSLLFSAGLGLLLLQGWP